VSAEARPASEGRVVRGGLRAWIAPGIRLADVAPGGDPDRLLTRPDCEMVKLQPKVAVGVLTTPSGRLYVKRYSIFAWRVALGATAMKALLDVQLGITKMRGNWYNFRGIPIMPTFQGQVNEEDLLKLLAYIKSLAPPAKVKA